MIISDGGSHFLGPIEVLSRPCPGPVRVIKVLPRSCRDNAICVTLLEWSCSNPVVGHGQSCVGPALIRGSYAKNGARDLKSHASGQ